jgi:hypothetical protein
LIVVCGVVNGWDRDFSVRSLETIAKSQGILYRGLFERTRGVRRKTI